MKSVFVRIFACTMLVAIAPRLGHAQEVTLAGTTGTDAAVVTAPWPAILNCSGASGAGVNLPYPVVGAQYTVKNSSSGTMKVYCVGGSINGTTGTTAVTLTTTGALGDIFSTLRLSQVSPRCSEAAGTAIDWSRARSRKSSA